jgi:hypothetical protein
MLRCAGMQVVNTPGKALVEQHQGLHAERRSVTAAAAGCLYLSGERYCLEDPAGRYGSKRAYLERLER